MYDYIIIGAGAAGCVLANRLTADSGTTVLLLEAGGPAQKQEVKIPAAFAKLFKSELDWNYTAEGAVPGQEQYWPRGKGLGGSTTMNAMMAVRGHRGDYDEWRDQGNPGWGYADVLPYFKKSESHEAGAGAYHGADGPLSVASLPSPNPLSRAFVAAGAAMGLAPNEDVNGATQAGIGLTHVFQKGGRRWSAADAYLQPARKRPNLTVATGAQASRVLVDGQRATGVEFRQEGQTRTAAARREVLLCGGAVNSPQLLLLSGIGPGEHLRELGIALVHDLPGVGRNLQDHVAAAATFACTRPVTLAAAETLGNLLRYLVLKKGPLTSNAAEALAFIRTQPDLARPDVELIFLPVYFMYHTHKNPEGHGFSIGSVLLRPRSRGRISLAGPDPLAAPRIESGAFSRPEDMPPLVAAVRFVRELVQMPALAPFRGAEVWPGAARQSDAAIADHICANFQSVYHPIGTCKMGRDEMAVVDAALRVRGVAGLRVIDASIMPTLPGGHTQAPTVMIAEKAADLLRNGG